MSGPFVGARGGGKQAHLQDEVERARAAGLSVLVWPREGMVASLASRAEQYEAMWGREMLMEAAALAQRSAFGIEEAMRRVALRHAKTAADRARASLRRSFPRPAPAWRPLRRGRGTRRVRVR